MELEQVYHCLKHQLKAAEGFALPRQLYRIRGPGQAQKSETLCVNGLERSGEKDYLDLSCKPVVEVNEHKLSK